MTRPPGARVAGEVRRSAARVNPFAPRPINLNTWNNERATRTSSWSAPGHRAAAPPTGWPPTGVDVAVAREGRLPAREGLRRRAHPPRHQALIEIGIDVTERPAGCTTGACGSSAAGCDWNCTGRISPIPGLRARPAPADMDQLLAGHAGATARQSRARRRDRAGARREAGRITGVMATHRDPGPGPRCGSTPPWWSPRTATPAASRRVGPPPPHRPPARGRGPTYFTSPRTNDDFLESWLELWDGRPGPSREPPPRLRLDLRDGRRHLNVGLGILNSSAAFQNTDWRDMLRRWLDNTPPEWGFTTENQIGQVRGAAPPMAFNRAPQYADGLLLVGDAAGMVNPFNGEGIAYALESGGYAAEAVIQALGRPHRRPGPGPGGLSAGAEVPGAGRLLQPRSGLRPVDRAPRGHAAVHPPRHAAPDDDAARAQAAREPRRPPRGRCHGPRDRRPDPSCPGRPLTAGARPGLEARGRCFESAARIRTEGK